MELHIGVLLDVVAQVVRRMLAADVEDECLAVRRAPSQSPYSLCAESNERERRDLPKASLRLEIGTQAKRAALLLHFLCG